MSKHIFVAVYFLMMSGCDMEDSDSAAKSEVYNEENVNLRCEGVTAIDERQREAITITDVVLRESEGGYYTNNRFMCNVRSRVDCEATGSDMVTTVNYHSSGSL